MFLSGLSSRTIGKPPDSSFFEGICGDSYIMPLSFKLEERERLDPKLDDLLFLYFIKFATSLACSSLIFSIPIFNYFISSSLILKLSSFLLISPFNISILLFKVSFSPLSFISSDFISTIYCLSNFSFFAKCSSLSLFSSSLSLI